MLIVGKRFIHQMVPLQIQYGSAAFQQKFQMSAWRFWYWPRQCFICCELIANAAGERGNASTTIFCPVTD